jgi:YHS domain-containing protein
MKLMIATHGVFLSFLSVLLFVIGFGGLAFGKSPLDNLAIRGYDPVAYFEAGKAITGSGAFTFQWHNKTWFFSTRTNRDLFATSPEKYAPQYDGYCAWAMTESRKADSDPEVWKIFDGRLYLNCSRTAYEKWARDIPGNIQKADRNWLILQNSN